MFWTAFVWGIGVAAGGSIGLMVFVILYTAWYAAMKSPAATRAEELSEFAYTAMRDANEVSEKQLTQLTALAAAVAIIGEFVAELEQVEYDSTSSADRGDDDGGDTTGIDEADLCDHPHANSLYGLGGFEG